MKISAKLDRHHCDCWTCFSPLESRFNGITRLKKSHFIQFYTSENDVFVSPMFANWLLWHARDIRFFSSSEYWSWWAVDWLWLNSVLIMYQHYSDHYFTQNSVLCLLFFCSNFNTIKKYANVCTHIKINAVTGCVFSCKRIWLHNLSNLMILSLSAAWRKSRKLISVSHSH